MPSPPKNPERRPVTLDDLIRKAASTGQNRRARAKALNALAKRAARGQAIAEVFDRLTSAGEDGPRLALDFFARLPAKPPPTLAPTLMMLLKQKVGPAPIRIAAAGNLLAVLPDTPDSVQPVLKALTEGHSRSAALERLIRLQSYVRKCRVLDQTVATSEAKLPLKCPKCRAEFRRSDLIRHLWHQHKLIWVEGQVGTPQTQLERAMNEGVQSVGNADPDRLDAAFGQTALYYPDAPPRQVFQALAARGAAHPAQLEPLLDRAAGERCGLCPACLSAVPDPIPELPPPAAVGGGRLAAEGYAVDVHDGPFGRVAAVTTRDGSTTTTGRRIPPRELAVLVAGGLMLAGTVAVGVVAPRLALPVAALATGVGWLAYAAVRLLRPALPDAREEAVDRAWAEVYPGIGRKPHAIRFLIRLCRTSIGVGNPIERTPAVWELVEQAAVLADKGGVYLQLFAVARVLQVCDGGESGRERIAGLVKVFDPLFRYELPLAYGEAAAEALLAANVLSAGESGRLAVLLIGVAFDAGFLPSDLNAIAHYAPWLGKLIGSPSDLHLRALYAVWRGRNHRRWTEVGPAETVFEFAERTPTGAKKVLGQYPDAVLVIKADDPIEKELGPELVCTAGVVAGGATVADPDAPVELTDGGRELRFGSHRIGLSRKLSARVVPLLKGWLRYRGRVLLPLADQGEPRGSGSPRSAYLLGPLAVPCPLCSTISVVRTGQLGTRVGN